jgi:hypothetical protein
MLRPIHVGIAVSTCICINVANAHHSYAEYDDQQTIEFEGRLVDVAWQNPHVRIVVEAADPIRGKLTWDIETTSLNAMRRISVPFGILTTGGTVKVAGWPSKKSNSRMYATHLLAPNGQEMVFWRLATPRWSDTALGFGSVETVAQFRGGVAAETPTLFTVWATDVDDLPSYVPAITTPLPLTESAQKAVAAFDPTNETVTVGCTPKGMPIVMLQPPPIEFVDRGDTILLRTEEYDSVRTIHMKPAGSADPQPRTPLGYSVGRWEDKTLVVETNQVSAKYLNARGAPLGGSARFVERFTPSTDGSRLDYTLTITDPDSLTATVERKRWWVRRPGEQVMAFHCGERVERPN